MATSRISKCPSNSRDTILAKKYEQRAETVDQIVIDPDLVGELCEAVNNELPRTDHFDSLSLANRLMNLRKNGQLVRKHRGFNGRSKKPR